MMALFNWLQATTDGSAGDGSSLDVGLGIRENLRLLDMPEMWVVVMVILPLVAIVAYVAYARESVGRGMRGLLVALRMSALGVLLFILFRPVLVQHSEEVRPAQVLVLMDDSASMRRQDTYLGDEGARQALKAFQLQAGTKSLNATSRLELAQAAVTQALGPKLEAGDYELRLVRFAEDSAPIASLDVLGGRGRATHLGDALRQALAQNRGRHITDIVVISDGRSTGGRSPLDAARAAGAAGIPVHTVVVGDTRRERNVFVELAEVPSDVLEGDEVSITVRVAGRGTDADSSSTVTLEELSGPGQKQGRLIAEELVTPSEAGERKNFLAPAEAAEPGARVRRFRVHIQPIPDETVLEDNTIEFSVRVNPEQIRVLYVDGYPRWEYRFLKELLKRADQNISMQVYLMSATPDFPQEHSPRVEALTEVPTARKDLLENYDVILLGDIDPDAISPDPARCEEFQASLIEFVERGGGVLFMAGENNNPRSFLDTPLEELMPVVLNSESGLPYQGNSTIEFKPTLENPAQPHQVVRLDGDAERNRRLWEAPEGLRGQYWYSQVGRAKPGSQVLLRHPTEGGPHGRHPLCVVGYHPAGRTMFLAIDSTWMWRYRFGDRYHGRFWRNTIRWLALGRLKGGDRRYHLDSVRSVYSLEERITLEARVLDEDFSPSDRPVQGLVLSDPDGTQTEISATKVPGRDGVYRHSMELGRPGLYQAWIDFEGEQVASTEFELILPSRENADPSPDPEELGAVASISGGRSVSLAALPELFPEFPGGEERRDPISSRLDDAWDNWWSLLVVLSLLSVEWILRKRFQMV